MEGNTNEDRDERETWDVGDNFGTIWKKHQQNKFLLLWGPNPTFGSSKTDRQGHTSTSRERDELHNLQEGSMLDQVN